MKRSSNVFNTIMNTRLKRPFYPSYYYLTNIRFLITGCCFFFTIGNVLLLSMSRDNYNMRTFESIKLFGYKDTFPKRPNVKDVDKRFAGVPTLESETFMHKNSHSRKLMEDRGDNNAIKFVDHVFDSEDFNLSDDWLREAVGKPDMPLLSCAELKAVENVTYLSRGWTKTVYRGVHKGRGVAVKAVDVHGHDVTSCLAEGRSMTSCYSRAAKKIVKEVVLLSALRHENIIQILGFCVSPEKYDGHDITSVAMVTELGEPMDQLVLFQMSWENRLRITLEISRLVHYLSTSPIGPIALNDFRYSQFVLVDGSLKLTDVDDAGHSEPSCSTIEPCQLSFNNISKRLTCGQGKCQGHNEALNLYKTGKEFVRLLLPMGSPGSLKPVIADIVNVTSQMDYSSAQLLEAMQSLVDMYKTGAHLDRGRNTSRRNSYTLYRRSDLPGQYDYRCRLSLSGDCCTVSVFDLQEAKDICDSSPECKGFVWTRSRTWAGRAIVHLKNGFGATSTNPQTDLFVKQVQH